MRTNTCANCGAETVPIGQSVKCFDCGRFHGRDPGLKRAMMNAIPYYADLGYGIENVRENGVITITDTFGETRDVRVTTLISDTKTRLPPLNPGLAPSLMTGVDVVVVYFRDLNCVQRYRAVPFRERQYAATATVQNSGASA